MGVSEFSAAFNQYGNMKESFRPHNNMLLFIFYVKNMIYSIYVNKVRLLNNRTVAVIHI